MRTFRIDATVTKDGTLTLDDLPFQAGESVEVIIISRAALPETENGYSLRGKVIHYDNPTEPVAQEGWEAPR